jgi:hypothetical protein
MENVNEKPQDITVEEEVLKLPLKLHQALLELAYQKAQVEKEMRTVVETFFLTKNLNPQEYSIDLKENIIKNVANPKPSNGSNIEQ